MRSSSHASQMHCQTVDRMPVQAWISHPPVQRQTRSMHLKVSCQSLTIPGTQRVQVGWRSRNPATQQAQQQLLDAISRAKGRGVSGISPEQQAAVQEAVDLLEKDGGLRAPTASPLLEGRWRLLFTTRPGTASPIQRTFTGVDSFTVYQEILFSSPDGPRVNNIVDFGPKVGFLKVEAEASTDSQPLPGFTPRKGAGLPFLGKSVTYPPARRDLRVDFQFDRAAFTFRMLPFKVPYPVPFKLFGDETKGWIDITYMSEDGSFRLTKGNKGTLFVLVKDITLKQRLLEACQSKGCTREEVEGLIEQLVTASSVEGDRRPAQSPRAVGKWRLRWSAQAENANGLQRQLAGVADNFQIIESDGQLQNTVQLGPLLSINADATCRPDGSSRTIVDISTLYAKLGPLRIPFPFRSNKDKGADQAFVDWLYLDDTMRITRGSKGSLFIHTRET